MATIRERLAGERTGHLFQLQIAIWLVALLGLGAAGAEPSRAAEVTRGQEIPVPGADEAVAVFIREQRFVGGARTMFVYAGDRFAGVLDNGTWTSAVLPPGEVTLWLNWAKVTHAARLEAGRVHYFNIPLSGFVEVDEATGKALIAAVGDYATPSEKEEKTAQEHLRERYGKAQQAAARAPEAKPATGRGERERHIARGPRVDLAAYPVLVVEEFEMADPKAAERSKEYLVDTAPGRLASQLVQNLPAGLFEQVHRGSPGEAVAGAVVLRGQITQYKPGSAAGRAMLAGVGAARMDIAVQLVDAASGEELAGFADERSWAWGGAVGAAGGIETIEQNLAYELTLYLERGKGRQEPSSLDESEAEP
jgi:hypothetical protein